MGENTMRDYLLGLSLGFLISMSAGAIYEAWKIKNLRGWKYNWRIWIPLYYVKWQYSKSKDER